MGSMQCQLHDFRKSRSSNEIEVCRINFSFSKTFASRLKIFFASDQGFLARGARNVLKGCRNAESLKLIRPAFL